MAATLSRLWPCVAVVIYYGLLPALGNIREIQLFPSPEVPQNGSQDSLTCSVDSEEAVTFHWLKNGAPVSGSVEKTIPRNDSGVDTYLSVYKFLWEYLGLEGDVYTCLVTSKSGSANATYKIDGKASPLTQKVPGAHQVRFDSSGREEENSDTGLAVGVGSFLVGIVLLAVVVAVVLGQKRIIKTAHSSVRPDPNTAFNKKLTG